MNFMANQRLKYISNNKSDLQTFTTLLQENFSSLILDIWWKLLIWGLNQQTPKFGNGRGGTQSCCPMDILNRQKLV
jgi:hypothetical protein